MRRLQDPENVDLTLVLQQLLATGVTITAREVARRHPTLKNASQFTRNETRNALIAHYAQQQKSVRVGDSSSEDVQESQSLARLREQLRDRDSQIETLTRQNKALVASYAECIRAVRAHGGIHAIARFWKAYKEIADTVREAGAVVDDASVVDIRTKLPTK